MANTWITDITHFLDGRGHIGNMPPAARKLADFFGAIVASITPEPWGTPADTHLHCRRRPQRRPCAGTIAAWVDPDNLQIEWECSNCGDNGVIHHWQATPWDCSHVRSATVH